MINAPCKICNSRHPRCHEDCELYKDYRKEMDNLLKERMRANQLETDFISVKEHSIKKRKGWIR